MLNGFHFAGSCVHSFGINTMAKIFNRLLQERTLGRFYPEPMLFETAENFLQVREVLLFSGIPCRSVSIIFWKSTGADAIPKGNLVY